MVEVVMKSENDDAIREFSEIQGLIASGYARQRAMCCLLLRIVEIEAARNWIAGLIPQITFCGDQDGDSKLNVALTYSGLQQLLDQDTLQGFSREFQEGMVTPHRQRVLGDLPGSPGDPQCWKWGGPHRDTVHLLVLVYELNCAVLSARLEQLHSSLSGVQIVTELKSTSLQHDKEHFGFRDGISQPWIAGLHKPQPERDRVAMGELVIGYDDGSGVAEPAPAIATNGSYLVLRQLVQLVPEFWSQIPNLSDEDSLRVAAKRVGRWPDGTPLALSPEPPETPNPSNDFDFSKLDPDGIRCPIGSHIRRANPRDGLLDDPAQSLQEVNRHRILRRGRTFGLPAPPESYPRGLSVRADDDDSGDAEHRGLLFICLVASLSRQFEFCQHTWLNNPKFLSLSTDTDSVASPVQWSGPDQQPTLTFQECPARFRAMEPSKCVYTIGGEYFYLAGRSMLLRISRSQ
jgi:Dyp-type peroxidase family